MHGTIYHHKEDTFEEYISVYVIKPLDGAKKRIILHCCPYRCRRCSRARYTIYKCKYINASRLGLSPHNKYMPKRSRCLKRPRIRQYYCTYFYPHVYAHLSNVYILLRYITNNTSDCSNNNVMYSVAENELQRMGIYFIHRFYERKGAATVR